MKRSNKYAGPNTFIYIDVDYVSISLHVVWVDIYFIQEDLLKINKNMLKLIQLFTSAWRNKDTEKRGKRKIRQAVVHTAFTKRKTKLSKKNKKKNKLTHKYIQNKYECMMAAK